MKRRKWTRNQNLLVQPRYSCNSPCEKLVVITSFQKSKQSLIPHLVGLKQDGVMIASFYIHLLGVRHLANHPFCHVLQATRGRPRPAAPLWLARSEWGPSPWCKIDSSRFSLSSRPPPQYVLDEPESAHPPPRLPPRIGSRFQKRSSTAAENGACLRRAK